MWVLLPLSVNCIGLYISMEFKKYINIHYIKWFSEKLYDHFFFSIDSQFLGRKPASDIKWLTQDLIIREAGSQSSHADFLVQV